MPFADLLTSDHEVIIVQTAWNESELVKKIPGARWNNNMRVWTLPITWAACQQLRGTFGDSLRVGDKLVAWATTELEGRVDPANALRELTSLDAGNEALRPFQRAGVRFLEVADGALLADDMGTGKTIQTLMWLRANGDSALPALVVCPNSVKHNWRREAERWVPDVHPYVIEGGAATRVKKINAAALDPDSLIIINYESLRGHTRLAPYGSIARKRCVDCGGRDPNVKTTACEVHARHLNNVPLRTVVLDEAHKIKDPAAKQTRATWAVGHQDGVTYRTGLTGTAIANDVSDLWSLLHFLVPDEFPTKSLFVERYCVTSWSPYGGLEVVGLNPTTRDEFFRIFNPRFRRMIKDVVLPQLPAKVRTQRFVELTPAQLRAYRDVTDQPFARLEDGTPLVVPSDLELHLRQIQLSSANLKTVGVTPEGKPRYEMCEPSSKVDALVDIIEELGNRQVAVAAEHRQLINLASARLTKLQISHGLITGGQQPFERDAALAEFQAGKTQVLLFTIKAGGTGLTMTAADTLVRLQRSWSLIDNKQTEDRIHRIGAEHHDSVQIIDLVARATTEERQVERLTIKLLRLEEINRDRVQLKKLGESTAELDQEEQLILSLNMGDLT